VTASRGVAIRALVRVEGGAFANVALPATLRASGLGPRDRAQVTDWVYGTLRRRRTLDHLLAPALDRRVERLDPPVRAALRLGAYQLMTGVPAHAAVGETVDAVAVVAPRAKGFVNAVLRRVAASGPPFALPDGADTESVGIRTSVPEWIVQRLVADLGRDDALATLATVNDAAPVTLRVNPRRADPDAVADELTAAGAQVARGRLFPDALLVTGAGDLRSLPAVAEGRVTPQDQSSRAVAHTVGARPGERVLEIGAAPGGMATAIAEQMDDDGLVVALDLHPGRTRMVADAARRLGLLRVTPVVADAAGAIPLRAGCFDRVLLDAPCSGLGVLRRRPEARWRLQPDAIDDLAARQRALLTAAARMVRPGGRLVYAVCTLSAAETVGIDEWAAAARPDLVAEAPPGPPWTPTGRGARLLPPAADTDGMYCLVLRAPG
jgi:16S rRNA (cytosine967-C5)-methyltransferase